MAEGKGIFSKLGNWSISHTFGMLALATILPGVSKPLHGFIDQVAETLRDWGGGLLSGLFNKSSGASELAAGVTTGVPIKSTIAGLPGVTEDYAPI